MPYIKREDRNKLMSVNFPVMETPGELNFLITKLIKHYMWNLETNYVLINEIVGALESAKLEFYRRVVVPYEEKKIEQNGDVY